MSLDPATVRRIATLARIRLDEAGVALAQEELHAILGWVHQLHEVDVEGVEPLAGVVQASLRMRPDEVTDGDIVEEVLANAPGRAGAFFTVPKVVE